MHLVNEEAAVGLGGPKVNDDFGACRRAQKLHAIVARCFVSGLCVCVCVCVCVRVCVYVLLGV
jgi:hypothetical protein